MIDLPAQQVIAPTAKAPMYAAAVIHHENDSQLVHFITLPSNHRPSQHLLRLQLEVTWTAFLS
jgi:hypothetical protein